MKLFNRIREYLKRHNDLNAGRDPVWGETPTAAMPAPVPAVGLQKQEFQLQYFTERDYDPAIKAKLAELKAKAEAEADARAVQASAETEQWGTWDQPGELAPLVPAHEPPPMPSADLSQVMVNQITYPDPADLSYDKDRKYRELYKRTGVATGTHASQEDTGVWALPALEPGDGTGVPLAGQKHGETGPEVAA